MRNRIFQSFLTMVFVAIFLAQATPTGLLADETAAVDELKAIFPKLNCDLFRLVAGTLEYPEEFEPLNGDYSKCRVAINDLVNVNGLPIETADANSEKTYGDSVWRVASKACDGLISNIPASAREDKRITCIWSTPIAGQGITQRFLNDNLRRELPHYLNEGSRCTELPTKPQRLASNADLFSPLLDAVPAGSSWPEIRAVLRKNGFSPSTLNVDHENRFVFHFIYDGEPALDRTHWIGPMVELVDVYVGRRFIPRIYCYDNAWHCTGPLASLGMRYETKVPQLNTGLCLTWIVGP